MEFVRVMYNGTPYEQSTNTFNYLLREDNFLQLPYRSGVSEVRGEKVVARTENFILHTHTHVYYKYFVFSTVPWNNRTF